MFIIKIIFLAFFALGLVVYLKFFAIPFIRRQYKVWISIRKLRRMARGKPPELQEQLKELENGFKELLKQDKM